MTVFEKISAFLSLRDEDEEEIYESEGPPPRNVVPFSGAGRRGGTEVGVYSPRSFGDVTAIADALRARQVVIINLQTADRALLQRVVDFTSGVTYTLEGKIQKLAEAMYLVVPSGVSINIAGLREQLADGMLDFMGNRG